MQQLRSVSATHLRERARRARRTGILLGPPVVGLGVRVRPQSGNLAGVVEGTVSALGLLYVTLSQGEDVVLVPNNSVVSAAIVPLREPGKVDLLARLRPGVKPSELQRVIEDAVE